jgi:hypothetical protein
MAPIETKSKRAARKTTNNGARVNGRPSREEPLLKGKQLRTKCPRSSHAQCKAANHRIDPLVVMKQSEKGRIAELLPI